MFFNRLRQQDPTLDIMFGIHFTYDDNIPRIRIIPIKIDDDNIIIEHKVYHGTPGLWSLITDKVPQNYNRKDLEEYTGILKQTNVLHKRDDPNNLNPRASKSVKWQKI